MNSEQSLLSSALANAHVLVVEDDLMIQEAIRGTFDEWQCKASIVGNLAEARHYLANNQPCVMFLDNRLPDGQGLDEVGTFREINPHCQVVVLTADIGPSTQKRARLADVRVAYKPVSEKELAHYIELAQSGQAIRYSPQSQ